MNNKQEEMEETKHEDDKSDCQTGKIRGCT